MGSSGYVIGRLVSFICGVCLGLLFVFMLMVWPGLRFGQIMVNRASLKQRRYRFSLRCRQRLDEKPFKFSIPILHVCHVPGNWLRRRNLYKSQLFEGKPMTRRKLPFFRSRCLPLRLFLISPLPKSERYHQRQRPYFP